MVKAAFSVALQRSQVTACQQAGIACAPIRPASAVRKERLLKQNSRALGMLAKAPSRRYGCSPCIALLQSSFHDQAGHRQVSTAAHHQNALSLASTLLRTFPRARTWLNPVGVGSLQLEQAKHKVTRVTKQLSPLADSITEIVVSRVLRLRQVHLVCSPCVLLER